MTSNIKLKRSAIPGKIPTVSQLELGEFAVNTYDGRLYTKKNVDGVESIIKFQGISGNEALVILDTFTGNSSTTTFTLSRIPLRKEDVFITINGVSQHVSEYSLVGNSLTFTEAPALNDLIEVRALILIPADVAVRDYQTYVYNADSSTVFTGEDVNGRILTYDFDKIEVYVNGVRLVNILDYTATSGSSVTVLEPVTGVVEIVSLSKATFASDTQPKAITTSLTTTTANQVADTFDAGVYRTAKYVVQVSSGSNYHSVEILLLHDGTTVYITEYATLYTNTRLATFDGDINQGLVRLLITPTLNNSTVKIQRISIGV